MQIPITMITSIITSLFIQRRQKSERKQVGQLSVTIGAAIEVHDVMLTEKEEFGRGGFGEICVLSSRQLCCFTLPDIPLYLKSP